MIFIDVLLYIKRKVLFVIYILFDLLVCLLLFPVHVQQERMMTSFYLRREEEERVTSYFGRGKSRISLVYYKYM